jgi:selenide,water dikinase
MGMIPAGTYANREHLGESVRIETPEDDRVFAGDILFDPQTSGGLLFAVDPAAADAFAGALRAAFPHTAIIGEFERGDGTLRIV